MIKRFVWVILLCIGLNFHIQCPAWVDAFLKDTVESLEEGMTGPLSVTLQPCLNGRACARIIFFLLAKHKFPITLDYAVELLFFENTLSEVFMSLFNSEWRKLALLGREHFGPEGLDGEVLDDIVRWFVLDAKHYELRKKREAIIICGRVIKALRYRDDVSRWMLDIYKKQTDISDLLDAYFYRSRHRAWDVLLFEWTMSSSRKELRENVKRSGKYCSVRPPIVEFRSLAPAGRRTSGRHFSILCRQKVFELTNKKEPGISESFFF